MIKRVTLPMGTHFLLARKTTAYPFQFSLSWQPQPLPHTFWPLICLHSPATKVLNVWGALGLLLHSDGQVPQDTAVKYSE